MSQEREKVNATEAPAIVEQPYVGKSFEINEKVLCREPDLTKAQVLWHAKVIELIQPSDERNVSKTDIEYLVHFKGWKDSWNRTVPANFILKDTSGNRLLKEILDTRTQKQRTDLAGCSEDSHIFLDKTNRPRHMADNGNGDDGPSSSSAIKNMLRTSAKKLDVDTDTQSSSVDSTAEDERVTLHAGLAMKRLLMADAEFVRCDGRLHALPARMPAIRIIEQWAKQSVIKECLAHGQPQDAAHQRRRRRNSSAKQGGWRDKDYDQLVRSIALRKEVADGIRVYINFVLPDYLLYTPEKQQYTQYMSDVFRRQFRYEAPERLTLDMITRADAAPPVDVDASSGPDAADSAQPMPAGPTSSGGAKRRLRSHKHDESECIVEIGLAGGDKNSASSSVHEHSDASHGPATFDSLSMLRDLLPPGTGISLRSRDILQNMLDWQIVPNDAPIEPSMIYGATHLARLMIKLPDFLNATPFNDDKLRTVLIYLDSFVKFLEQHSEWFGEEYYCAASEDFSRPEKDVPKPQFMMEQDESNSSWDYYDESDMEQEDDL